MVDGEYRWEPTKLPQAHRDCLHRTKGALSQGQTPIVHNTFAAPYHLQPYIQTARKF